MAPATSFVLGVLAVGVILALALSGLALAQAQGSRRRMRPVTLREPDLQPPPSNALQHVGVVRFNPYHDTGGDYSFAVALLDAAGNGLVLTGLYHRDRCRVYAKPIQGWTSSYTLTDEERAAIEQARGAGQLPGPV